MKKSLLIVILSLLLVLIGCQKKIDTKRIAVVSNQKENKVLLLDNNNRVLAQKLIDGNYRFLLQIDCYSIVQMEKSIKALVLMI